MLFCTSYFDTEEVYQKRYRKWIDYYSGHPFCRDKDLFLIDDHSDLRLVDGDIHVIGESEFGCGRAQKINLIHFGERKGGPEAANSAGWYRSFLKSLDLARRFGYERIVHAESDAYLISRRIFDYIEETRFGWTMFWCHLFRFPETGLQVICKDQFPLFERFQSKGHDFYVGKMAEWTLPYTRLEAFFNGDRFGEYAGKIGGDDRIRQVDGMDYYTQCSLNVQIQPES